MSHQHTYYVTSSCVQYLHKTEMYGGIRIQYFVCVCACACVCVRVRACVYANGPQAEDFVVIFMRPGYYTGYCDLKVKALRIEGLGFRV